MGTIQGEFIVDLRILWAPVGGLGAAWPQP